MLVPEEHQVTVNLVADNKGAVLDAQLPHPPQLLLGPNLAHRVVGVAEDEEGGTALEGLFKGLKVQGINIVLFHQGNGEALAAPVFHRIEEFAIDRGQKQHLVPRLGKLPHAGAKGGHHPQAEDALLGVGPPAVALLLPLADRLEIGVRAAGVAKDGLAVPGVDGVQDGLGGAEVHIGNPHGEKVPAAVLLFHLVVLHGVVVPAVNGTVKIILHL